LNGEERFLCLARTVAGQDFLRQCAASQIGVTLLTLDELRKADWPHEALENLATMPDGLTQDQITNTVAWMARSRHYSRIVALDEASLACAAALREHLRIPGMGLTTAGYYRDRLAMRISASESGFTVGQFVRVLNYEDLSTFMERVPAPWILRPRRNEPGLAILQVNDADQLWRELEALGDLQSHYLLEELVEGELFTVESIINECRVVFSAVHRHSQPGGPGSPLCVATVDRGSREWEELTALNAGLAPSLGMVRGLAHTRFLRSAAKDKFVFDGVAAAVGAGLVDQLTEAAFGMNLWREWARLEAAHLRGESYLLTEWNDGYAGVLLWPEDEAGRAAWTRAAQMDLPEIVERIQCNGKLGVVVRSALYEQVNEILSWLRRG
jgi:hypothetical protein